LEVLGELGSQGAERIPGRVSTAAEDEEIGEDGKGDPPQRSSEVLRSSLQDPLDGFQEPISELQDSRGEILLRLLLRLQDSLQLPDEAERGETQETLRDALVPVPPG